MTQAVAPARLETTSHPLLYEVNTRVLLRELSTAAGQRVTLDRIPDRLIDEWADLGFDAVWMMGTWTTGRTGLAIARQSEELGKEFRATLADFTPRDVIGSPYAVKAYRIPPAMGGAKGLQVLRRRLARRGLRLILDYVSNHTARDHAWVERHPEYYVQGPVDAFTLRPDMFFPARTASGPRSIAYGKDPYFPGWTDTAQLNVLHPASRAAMVETLRTIATQCDGVRCDMAMLLLSDVFVRTWGSLGTPAGIPAAEGEFWREAIAEVRSRFPSLLFIAEAYWDLEWRLQQLGFDYTYDKKLSDRLLREGAWAVREHLKAEEAYQRRSVRFIENHDEQRAARLLPVSAWHCAAATIMATVPGMALFHDGQLEGRRVRLPVQLGRRPPEEISEELALFYRRLLPLVSGAPFRRGSWKLVEVRPAWHDNTTWTNIIASWWKDDGAARLVVVNYAPLNGQCYLGLDLSGVEGSAIEFRDLLSSVLYVRERNALLSRGLYFDLPPYGLHLFEVRPKYS